MNGLFFSFEEDDLVLRANGSFQEAVIDSQNCALIAVSQICRLTRAEIGEQIAAKIENISIERARPILAKAERAVKRDGGRDVSITINDKKQLQFKATYDD